MGQEFEFVTVMVASLDEINMDILRDKFGADASAELSEILCKIWQLQFRLFRYKQHGTIGPLVQKHCDQVVSVFNCISTTESSEPRKTFTNMLDLSLSLVQDATTYADKSPNPTSATASTQDGDDDAFRTPLQGTHRTSETTASPGGAKELVWSPTKLDTARKEVQPTEERRRKRAKVRDGTFLERRARYLNFAVKFIQAALRNENASRLQAQKPPISPDDIVGLVRRGKELGISRDDLAIRYSEVCPHETPDTIQWYHRNSHRAKNVPAHEEVQPLSLNKMFELAIHELHREATKEIDLSMKVETGASKEVETAEKPADAAAAEPEDAAEPADKNHKIADSCDSRPAAGTVDPSASVAKPETVAVRVAAAADPSAAKPADVAEPADAAEPADKNHKPAAKPETEAVRVAAAADQPAAKPTETRKGAAPGDVSSRPRRDASRFSRGNNVVADEPTARKLLAKENKRPRPGAPRIICLDFVHDARTDQGNNSHSSSESVDTGPPPKRVRSNKPLNVTAAANSPTSGLTQRAKDRGASEICCKPDRSGAQRGTEDCPAPMRGSILEGFTSPMERQQVSSILGALQEAGFSFLPLNSDSLCSPKPADAGSVCQIQARIDRPRDCTVLPGVEVTVLVERHGRPVDTLYNSPLFRQAHAISAVNSCRRRKPFDRFLEQPIPFSGHGEYFGHSFPDLDGKVVVFLVVERAAQNSEEWLSTSSENWRREGQMDERIRGVLQLGVHALSQFRDARIVLGNVKGSTIGVNHDGTVVFQGSGNSLRYNEGEICQYLQRRTTSFIVGNPGAIPEKDKVIKRLLRGRRAKAAAVRKKLPRKRSNLKGKQKSLKNTPKVDQQSTLPLERQPIFLSPTKLAEIMQGVVAKSEGLASLGDGSAHAKVVQSLPLSSEPLPFLNASQRDMYGLLRTGLMVFNPVDIANPDGWDKEATAAEVSKRGMRLFLTKRTSKDPLQPLVLDRAVDFFFNGFKSLNPGKLQDHPFLTLPIHPPRIYHQIFNGGGFRVDGGEVDGKLGAPPKFSGLVLKEVVVTKQGEMGAGLQGTAAYQSGDLITFYFGKVRRGTEILDDPPGRYVLAILAKYLYANGEFSETLTLAKFAERKAMGVCINAANAAKDKNCTILRREAKFDSAGNIWAPIVASRSIRPGEYFGLDYGPEAAYGRSFNQ